MIHPVTVKDGAGKVLRVISTESLKARSDALCDAGSQGHFASHKIREDLCGLETCRKTFWTKQRGKKYCSRDCTNIVARATAKATKARRKVKLKLEKEEQLAGLPG